MAYKELYPPTIESGYEQFKDDEPRYTAVSTGYNPPPAFGSAGYSQVPQPNVSPMGDTNTEVVGSQPTQLPPVTVREPSLKPGQKTLVLSLVLFALCSLTCQIWALFCLIPGLIFAVVGFNLSHSRDQRQHAGAFNGLSLCCSVTTVFSFVVTVVCLILYLGIYFGIYNTLRRYPYYY